MTEEEQYKQDVRELNEHAGGLEPEQYIGLRGGEIDADEAEELKDGLTNPLLSGMLGTGLPSGVLSAIMSYVVNKDNPGYTAGDALSWGGKVGLGVGALGSAYDAYDNHQMRNKIDEAMKTAASMPQVTGSPTYKKEDGFNGDGNYRYSSFNVGDEVPHWDVNRNGVVDNIAGIDGGHENDLRGENLSTRQIPYHAKPQVTPNPGELGSDEFANSGVHLGYNSNTDDVVTTDSMYTSPIFDLDNELGNNPSYLDLLGSYSGPEERQAIKDQTMDYNYGHNYNSPLDTTSTPSAPSVASNQPVTDQSFWRRDNPWAWAAGLGSAGAGAGLAGLLMRKPKEEDEDDD